MRSIIFILALLVSGGLLMAPSCKKTYDNPEGACATVTCTAMFAMVAVQVTDASGQPVTLDDAFTINMHTGEKIKINQQMGGGHYLILDDSYRLKLLKRTEEFHFIGIKNGVKAVDQPYHISADCCHVQKVSGPDSVVVR